MKAVSDSGPLIHLNELALLSCLNVFQRVLIPQEIENELKELTRFGKNVEKVELDANSKNKAEIFARQFSLDLGESEALALAKQMKIETLLTDDLDCREAAKQLSLTPVGTIGIIIASYKKRIISKQKCVDVIKNIKAKSTLFITQELIDYAIEKIK